MHWTKNQKSRSRSRTYLDSIPFEARQVHLREIFNAEDMVGKAARGELLVTKGDVKPRDFEDDRGNHIVGSQEWYFHDLAEPDEDICRAHRYITDTGETGASGSLGPKELTLGGFQYRIVKKKQGPSGTCRICSGDRPHPIKGGEKLCSVLTQRQWSIERYRRRIPPYPATHDLGRHRRPGGNSRRGAGLTQARAPFTTSRDRFSSIRCGRW